MLSTTKQKLLLIISLIGFLSLPLYAEEGETTGLPEAGEQTLATEADMSADSSGAIEKQPITSLTQAEYELDPFQLLRQLPDLDKGRSRSVVNHLKLFGRDEEIIELNDSEQPFYGLYISQRTIAPQGAILIVHDSEQHGHWPHVIAPLREYLPDYGWATFTIELPAPPHALLPTRDDQVLEQPETAEVEPETEPKTDSAAEPSNDNAELAQESAAEETDNEQNNDNETTEGSEPALPRLEGLPEPRQLTTAAEAKEQQEQTPPTPEIPAIEKYRQQVMTRLSQAMGYLNNRGQFNLALAGLGEGAVWVNQYLPMHLANIPREDDEENNSPKGFVIINIDGKNSELLGEPFYLSMVNIEVPFLDIRSRNRDLRLAKIERGKMHNLKRMGYLQVRLKNEFSARSAESQINRRVRGWLKTNAGGTELPIK